MRCSVKSGNERNPCRQLPSGNAGDSGETARVKREEGAAGAERRFGGTTEGAAGVGNGSWGAVGGSDDVKSVWLLRPGLHTCYNGRYNGMQYREMELIHKTGPSSD